MVLEITDGCFHIMIDQCFADNLHVAGLYRIQHPAVNFLLIVYYIFVFARAAIKDDGVAAVHAAPQGIQTFESALFNNAGVKLVVIFNHFIKLLKLLDGCHPLHNLLHLCDSLLRKFAVAHLDRQNL